MNVTADELKRCIGENVRHRRKELGFSQQEVAEAAEVTQSQIAQIESGKTSPSVEVVVKLASFLRTEPQWFYAPKSFSPTTA